MTGLDSPPAQRVEVVTRSVSAPLCVAKSAEEGDDSRVRRAFSSSCRCHRSNATRRQGKGGLCLFLFPSFRFSIDSAQKGFCNPPSKTIHEFDTVSQPHGTWRPLTNHRIDPPPHTYGTYTHHRPPSSPFPASTRNNGRPPDDDHHRHRRALRRQGTDQEEAHANHLPGGRRHRGRCVRMCVGVGVVVEMGRGVGRGLGSIEDRHAPTHHSKSK